MTAENQGSLSWLLEQDREQVCSSLQADRASDRARLILEKETDRLMYRAAQATENDARLQNVQGMLQVVKNALPFLESVTETEVWEKNSAQAGSRKLRISIPGILLLAGGLICIAAGLLGQASAGKILRPGALLWTAAGCILLAAGGFLAGRGGRKETQKPAETTQTFLVDPSQVWHVLQGIALTADHTLEEQENAGTGAESRGKAGRDLPDKEELIFFAELLENVYAGVRNAPQDAALAEQAESIRYYLHSRGIETEDYSAEHAKWFELLPSDGKSATIRPAMLHDGTLIRRGLAAQ